MDENISNINWFPGHMTKALRMMEKEIKIVDAIIYVLDARAPFSCVNPKLNKLIGNKPIIYVLNKCDMANLEITKDWQQYFSKIGANCIMLNSTESGTAKKVENAINLALKDKIEKQKQKGFKAIIRAMVLGVPNSGKSTLINNLCGVSKTITGNKAGVTKGKQWVKIASGIEILDTPGTLWPVFDNNQVAHHLAYIGSIKDEVLDVPSLSLDLIRDLIKIDKQILISRYNIEICAEDEPINVLEKICVARGFLLKKGELDYDRGAFAILNDFKQNRMGKISLEKTSDIKQLLIKNRKPEYENKN